MEESTDLRSGRLVRRLGGSLALREAVQVVGAHKSSTGHPVLLEASGGLTLDNAKDVAETGVHFISVGGLTHSSPILDIGLDFETVA